MKRFLYLVLVIFVCLVLVGCKKKSSNYIDSNKLEFRVDKSETVVFYFENDKVIAYEEWFKYKDADEAKQSLSITKNELNDLNVINIFRKKNYVVLGYSDKYIKDEFGKYTKEDIIKLYSIYENNVE